MKNNYVLWAGALIVIIFVVLLIRNGSSGGVRAPGMDEFAMCLEQKGATFYGAFWCPHCAAQKELFGASADKLPYVECSTPDGQGQTQVCKDAGVKSYPTWRFADGSTTTGETSLATLASKTGCVLPSSTSN